MPKVSWAKKSPNGYECSTKGDKRFSALTAKMPDGRTLEQWYQCDIKGYDIGGTNWKLGKGRPPLYYYSQEELWQSYLTLWRIWAMYHPSLINELATIVEKHNYTLTDCFANSPINQAHALSHLLNDWVFL